MDAGNAMACKDIVNRLFAQEDFEIRQVTEQPSACLVDYYDKHVEADIDIEVECQQRCGYDDEDPEFESCMDECEAELKKTVDAAELGSFYFDKDTLRIREATIPVHCSHVWAMEYDDDPVPFDKRMDKLQDRFDQIGCHLTSDWIHGHELAGNDEDETSPAMCYLHPHPRKQCRVDAVLRVLRDLRLGRI